MVTGIGEPLYLDRATVNKENLSLARVYTEVQLHNPLPTRLVVHLPDGVEHIIEVAYDWLLPTCSFCKELPPPNPICKVCQPVASQSSLDRKIVHPHSAMSREIQQDQIPQSIVVASEQPTADLPPSPPQGQVIAPMLQNGSEQLAQGNEEVDTSKSPVKPQQLDVNPTTLEDRKQPSPGLEAKRASLGIVQPSYNSQQKSSSGPSGSKQKGKGRGQKAARGGLLETHILAGNSERIKGALPSSWRAICNYDEDQQGRIWLVWDPSLLVTVYTMSKQAITCTICSPDCSLAISATFVYASNQSSVRQELWQEIRQLSVYPPLAASPWLIVDDFNQPLYATDRSDCVTPVSQSQGRQELADCIESVCLAYLPSFGMRFTWCNNQSANPLSVKLDRALCNGIWMDQHMTSYAEFLPQGPSDHAPCIIRFPDLPTKVRRPYKFQHHLTLVPEFLQVVSDCWNTSLWHGNDQFKLCKALKMIKEPLRQLNMCRFSNLSKRVAAEEVKLKLVQAELLHSPDSEKILLEKSVANARNAHNHIHFLEDKAGNRLTAIEDIKSHVVEYYSNLIGKTDDTVVPPSTSTLQDMLRYSCSSNLPESLTRFPSAVEIKQVLLSMSDNKAPGPDGFPKEFFQSTWSITGADLIRSVSSFFESGQLLGQTNATTIALIPKKAGASKLTDFRPISCCNTVYKIISTLLAKRLKPILQEIIAPNQTAILKGRLMMENILLATELIREYNRKNTPASAMVKIDIKKAFDTLSWEFLMRILRAMNLPTRFVNWIKACVTTPKFSIAINGELVGYFKGRRGLRQGDPLSPYLFILSMEVLSRMLDKGAASGRFRLHPRCSQPTITHLSFADDVKIFSSADKTSLQEVMNILHDFSKCSGLVLNQSKSEIFLGGVREEEANTLIAAIGIRKGSLPVKYLGVPLNPSKLPRAEFQPLLVDGLCASFLWKGNQTATGSYRVSWDTICSPKKEGGLGLRKLADYTTVFRLKLIWILFTKSGSLWAAWTRRNVFKAGSFWTCKVNNRCSWILRKLILIREQARMFLRKEVRDGKTTNFWDDCWTDLGPFITLAGDEGPRLLRINPASSVANAVTDGTWRLPGARSEAIQMIQIKLAATEPPNDSKGHDVSLWKQGTDDYKAMFSTSRTWEQIRQRTPQVDWFRIFKQKSRTIQVMRAKLDRNMRTLLLSIQLKSNPTSSSLLED
ncbi:PREDICTED: uncharacterized protein LOC104801567 [Tarenaya hassleriana]|uniref:uncharacterized protein LOC104801567 n=1 Tax=Tarenaya hassleriana TaxID=28532 RepID=UPI00053C8D0E|nr:PREDICTED: uncharacterized protein LOC104801567 [Tarenaya hassleriana]